MKTWNQALRDGTVTGGAAAGTSLGALVACGRRDDGSAVAPVNAVSHFLWGDAALRENEPTLRHTGLGVLTHVASALLWGVLYEKLLGSRRPESPLTTAGKAAAATAAIAAVDLKLVPERLTPGFERRLSARSLSLVYVALGVGLALGHRWATRRAV